MTLRSSRKRQATSSSSAGIPEEQLQINANFELSKVVDFFASNSAYGSRRATRSADRNSEGLRFPSEKESREILKMYQEDASNHVNSSAESISSIRQRFPIFKFQMMNGFNLLLHGFGSKKEILEDFATNFLNDAPKCVVNGYFPSLTIRQLLSTIRKDILMLTTSSRNLDQSVDEILSKMTYSRRFYLVINNIDGVALQDFYSQRILSLLAENPYISVIASIDNVHSQILWDSACLNRFGWLHHSVPTFESYFSETCFSRILEGTKDKGKVRAIRHVLNSQTELQKRVFKKLAQLQLNLAENIGSGVSEKEFLEKCLESLLVTSGTGLKNQLVELLDHGLVLRKQCPEKGTVYQIPFSRDVIMEEILSFGQSDTDDE